MLKSLIEITAKSVDKHVIYKVSISILQHSIDDRTNCLFSILQTFQALVKLRTDFVKDKEGIILFYNEGGLAPLVRLINKPYEKILEVALSILGNCCSMKDCCKQVCVQNHGTPSSITVIGVNFFISLFSVCLITGNNKWYCTTVIHYIENHSKSTYTMSCLSSLRQFSSRIERENLLIGQRCGHLHGIAAGRCYRFTNHHDGHSSGTLTVE